MKLLLDTDTCIHIIRKKSPRLIASITSLPPGELGISSITLAELEHGAEKSLDPAKNRQALEHFLIPIEIAVFDAAAAFHYGRVRCSLERAGRVIGSNDLLIAAHAISLSVPVVTGNVSEFSRVPGLKVENWISPGDEWKAISG